MKIQVGCGDSPIPGWRNFDNSISLRLARVSLLSRILRRAGLLNPRQFAFVEFARSHRIEYGDGVKGLPIPDSSVEALYSCHMIEHLSRAGAGRFLEEAKRVLIPGGVIRLAVPDLRRLALGYLESKDADGFLAASYLGRADDNSFRERLGMLAAGPRLHQWMYDEISLGRLLRSHGFSDVVAAAPGETRIREPGELDLREKEDESVYLEAVKPSTRPPRPRPVNYPAELVGPDQ
ncbi:MAG: methyltransferase domain-containing protein [Candidatus Erginobacter occultus]|nr:methyltransferase domain-containing protein [Candidatus Erginobacter occultus]